MHRGIPNAYILDITMYKIHVSLVLTIVRILISKTLTVTYKGDYTSVFEIRCCRQRYVLLYIFLLITEMCIYALKSKKLQNKLCSNFALGK